MSLCRGRGNTTRGGSSATATCTVCLAGMTREPCWDSRGRGSGRATARGLSVTGSGRLVAQLPEAWRSPEARGRRRPHEAMALWSWGPAGPHT